MFINNLGLILLLGLAFEVNFADEKNNNDYSKHRANCDCSYETYAEGLGGSLGVVIMCALSQISRRGSGLGTVPIMVTAILLTILDFALRVESHPEFNSQSIYSRY